jgi:hypothetical protein
LLGQVPGQPTMNVDETGHRNNALLHRTCRTVTPVGFFVAKSRELRHWRLAHGPV